MHNDMGRFLYCIRLCSDLCRALFQIDEGLFLDACRSVSGLVRERVSRVRLSHVYK